MKRVARYSWLLAAFALTSVSANAQSKITPFLGFGANFAASDYTDVDSAKTGYQMMAGLEMPLLGMKNLAFRVDGDLGWNGRDTNFRESTYLAGAFARLVWWGPKISMLSPYILGGVGLNYHKYNAGQSNNAPRSHTETMYGAGVGASFMVGPANAFVEGRYDYGADITRIYPLIVGVRFTPGKTK